ncbi:DUF4174 domain-containing protein [Parvularcula dongshanensis]|uniref:DUF4174 domain-containing protein n=1 Tax=Parvularcula dongshanensis TaxID=1173995 RepID=A0A840I2L8_9PROT|nr:DUF4174 domain-containing protein [Parvularcula dongshanensis]MBB4658474.1 hypothetical protein [Parvularcula dongshanensis]
MIPTILALFPIFAAAEVEPDLEQFRWSARPVLVFAGDEGEADRQRDVFEADGEALTERDVVVIVGDAGTGLASRYRPDGFTVILVGKDGGEKLRTHDVLTIERLCETIDAMPMRASEMRE